jgi:hypothetical protein
MYKFLKLTYCLLAVGLTLVCQAQTITPSATGLGNILLCQSRSYYIPANFTVPSSGTIVGYKFITSPGGNLENNQTFFTSNQIWVLWNLGNMQNAVNQGKDRYPFATIGCSIKYSYVSNDTTKYAEISVAPLTVQISGVGPITLTGATNVEKCSTPSLTYYAVGGKDADRYVWKVPAGWTVTGPSNGGISTGTNTFTTTSSYLDVTANSLGGGIVSCAAHMSQLEGLGSSCYYEQTADASISRINPSVSISVASLKPRYCPGQTIVLTAASSSGFTGNFTWNLPAGYTGVYSGAGNSIATVTIGSNTGSITATRTSCVGNFSSNSITTQIFNAVVPAAKFEKGTLQAIWTSYHCGQYNAAPTREGEVIVYGNDDIGTVTWSQVSANPSWTISDVTAQSVPATGASRQWSAIIRPSYLPASFSTITVTTKNCVNPIGVTATVRMNGEPVVYWQTHNYPENCQCCAAPTTGGGVIPRQRLRSGGNDNIDEIKAFADVSIYPNPSNGDFTIYFPENNRRCTIDILDINGCIVTQTATDAPQISLNMDVEANGVYIVVIKNEDETVYRKIVVNK